MATLFLHHHETHEGRLPRVCVRCGAPATLTRSQGFFWKPWYYWLIGFFGWVLYRHTRVAVPLCAAHRAHWTWRWAVPLVLLVLIAAAGAFTFMGLDLSLGADQAKALAGWVYGPALGLAAFVLLLYQVFRLTGIRATRIDRDGITLTGLSEAFVAAVNQQRTAEGVPRRATALAGPAIATSRRREQVPAVLPVAEDEPLTGRRPSRRGG